MSLIEGIGDEVTLVFGLVLLSLVILFAWISTHTDDVSLFREVGVMVVELSQRRSRHRVNRTEDGTSERQTGEETQTNSSGESTNDSVSSTSSPPVRADEQFISSESFPSAISPGAASNILSSADQGEDSESIQRRQQNETEVNNTNQDTFSDSSEIQDPSLQKDEGMVMGRLSSQIPLDGEEIRQRRVQYFQGEGHTELRQLSLSNERSNASSTDIDNTHTGSHDLNGFTSTSQVHVISSSSNENNCIRVAQVEEQGQAFTPLSEGIDSVLASESEASPTSLPNSQIRVKLKYLNETQRFVYAKPEDTIGDFRRTHFQSELEDNKWVRFIFNGQDLRDDGRTLQACNVVHDSTMHCLVTSVNRSQPQHAAAAEEEDDTMFGTLMYPLFTILLAIVWYFRFTYRQYFSAMSTICLIGISFTLALSYISSLRVADTQQAQPQPSTRPSSRNSNSRSSDPRPN